jgi:hypothetical protein
MVVAADGKLGRFVLATVWTLSCACMSPPPLSEQRAESPARHRTGAGVPDVKGDAAILSGDVQSVDGQPLRFGESDFALSPGCHRIGMKQDFVVAGNAFNVSGRMDPFDVDILMKPGHRYSVKYRMSDGAATLDRVAVEAYEADPATNSQRKLPVAEVAPGTPLCNNARE